MGSIYLGKTYNEFFEFVNNCKEELLIICPYIKLQPLQKLLSHLDIKSSPRVIVVARWKLADLIFGSSDIEVYNYLKSINTKLYINSKIHLKVIVQDKKRILLGSANITGSGMGLLEEANIEAITIDNLEPQCLEPLYEILHGAILVDDNLVERLRVEVDNNQNIKDAQISCAKELARLETEIIHAANNGILVNDFLFSTDPTFLLKNSNCINYDLVVKHDLGILHLSNSGLTQETLLTAFRNSNCYKWQLDNIKGHTLFGRYAELLHDALIDDPRPYRKDVKELVSNMFEWTKLASTDYKILDYPHTQAMVSV